MEPVPPLAPPPRQPSDGVPAVVEPGPGPAGAFRGLATRLVVVAVLLGLLVVLLTFAGR
jgi:hypothetical protein